MSRVSLGNLRVAMSREFDRLGHFTADQRAAFFYLLESRWCWDCGELHEKGDHAGCAAADEMDRLTAENERLREALQWYARRGIAPHRSGARPACHGARRFYMTAQVGAPAARERLATHIFEQLMERMMFRSAEVYSEGWAINVIAEGLAAALLGTPPQGSGTPEPSEQCPYCGYAGPFVDRHLCTGTRAAATQGGEPDDLQGHPAICGCGEEWGGCSECKEDSEPDALTEPVASDLDALIVDYELSANPKLWPAAEALKAVRAERLQIARLLNLQYEDGSWWLPAEPGPVECASVAEAVKRFVRMLERPAQQESAPAERERWACVTCSIRAGLDADGNPLKRVTHAEKEDCPLGNYALQDAKPPLRDPYRNAGRMTHMDTGIYGTE